ncbi:ABC transporter ATP-binding protein [Pseudomonas sp. LTJR-52]|uniref:ABC transporter ATP-binding protein n=1 Tax=Pseudomonas sp. LTJR-52 TaxID=2479392 RepID=UPI000EFBCE4A|nr:ABC transporter ATP-binding protein [Pseudomonas sp. LTJR-52]AYN96176.1 ABC transporter ATP-binding protein [Pseudomonas sp. LTJR-52]
MTLAAHRVSWSVSRRLLVDGVTLEIPKGGVIGLIGPNGSGKSSLLRLLAGLRTPTDGSVTLDNDPVSRLPRRTVARRIAMVEQHASTEADLSVLETVRLGRTPHRTVLSPWTARDDQVVEQALQHVGMHNSRHQRWHTLSGGERQRVQIARALAQEPTELLLDEPTNHLDIQHQLELLSLIHRLPLTCVLAIHDLNLAAMFCDTLAVLHKGRCIASGRPQEVLTAELIHSVYGVRAEVAPSAYHGRLHIQYLM